MDNIMEKCEMVVRHRHVWKPGYHKCQCGERMTVDGHEYLVPTGNLGISGEVSKLEMNYEDMEDLAGEIIATLIIQNNKKLFDHMPPEWFSAVEVWEKKFREIQNR